MPPPRHPSRIEPLTIPVFGISWYADPSNGRSLVAYAGGGGSARTGVANQIVVQDGDHEPCSVSTDTQVGVALQIYKNPVSDQLWMVVALGAQVRRYTLPDGEPAGVLHVDSKSDSCNALAVNGMADKLAVGCDSGIVKVYAISDGPFGGGGGGDGENHISEPLYTCEGHTKTVCALSFSMHGGRLLSSAKDGTARVWNDMGQPHAVLECTVEETPGTPPPRGAAAHVMVRGSAFVDLQGKVAVTVAATRRSKAFISRWAEIDEGGGFQCIVTTDCAPTPISAMSISQDAGLIALGSVDGSVILWSVADWSPLKIFRDVHDLPVTCIAARPFPVPLQGEEFTGVTVHVRSASADSKMACLTLQRRAPKRKQESGGCTGKHIMLRIHRLIQVALLAGFLSPIALDAVNKCKNAFITEGLDALRRCIVEDVLIAPASRPGITTPPL